MKKFCVISTRAPYASTAVRDALETLLAAASCDLQGTLLALGDGVFQLLANQNPENVAQKNTGAMLGLLPLYGIDRVYACEEDIKERGLDGCPMAGQIQRIPRKEIAQLLAQQHWVLNF
ncbi:MAG: sulfurtransferase complex subunit TusC [Kistimonas sp.]|nr:sulfurtransferase complex subunit TusC [Kistimonas sp.]